MRAGWEEAGCIHLTWVSIHPLDSRRFLAGIVENTLTSFLGKLVKSFDEALKINDFLLEMSGPIQRKECGLETFRGPYLPLTLIPG